MRLKSQVRLKFSDFSNLLHFSNGKIINLTFIASNQISQTNIVEIKQSNRAFQFGPKIVLNDCTDYHGKNPTIKHFNDVTNLRKYF